MREATQKHRIALVGAVLLLLLTGVLSAVPAPAAPYRLVFRDEFDGAGLDRAKWRTDGRWGIGTACEDNEGNHAVAGGVLHLSLRADPACPSGYSGATIQTAGYQDPAPFSFSYGYLEARVRVPPGQGI